MNKTLIRGARIVDGTGNPWFDGDIAVSGEYISQVGRISPCEDIFHTVVEADGLVLSPGFIDMHSHSDLIQLVQPQASAKIRQGITTELLGQDGLGVAPVAAHRQEQYRSHVAGLLGDISGDWPWQSFAEYLAALEQAKTATNLAVLVSHGPLRLNVLGMEEHAATVEEVAGMAQTATEAFAAGAFGLSTGLIYPPCIFGNSSEMEALAAVTARYDGIFVVHVRNERGLVLESIDEIFELGRRTGVSPHISHLKVIGRENWGRGSALLAAFEAARNDGLDVGFDQYPYPAGSTMLSILVPPHAHAGGPELLLARLGDPYLREVLAREMEEGLPGWENIASAAGWDGVLVTGVPAGSNKRWEGMSLAAIAREKHCTPQEVVFDLLIEEQLQVSMVNFSIGEQDVSAIIRHPLGMLGTDGLLGGKPHPRAYGSTARILGNYVREQGILSLEQAVARMTSRPAVRLGLWDRGLVRPGLKADLVLFDAQRIADMASYTEPCRHPAGLHYVWINGRPALERERETGVCSGVVLRKK